MGDFIYPGICWNDNTAELKQSRRFLECIGDNFLAQVTEESTSKGSLLDQILMNKDELV